MKALICACLIVLLGVLAAVLICRWVEAASDEPANPSGRSVFSINSKK